MKPTEQDLMAYADGELAETAALEIEAAVKADPALAEIVAEMQASRVLAQTAYDGAETAPMSPGLAALIEEIDAPPAQTGPTGAGQAQDHVPTSPVIPMPARPRTGAAAVTWPQAHWPALAAACVVAGLLIGTYLPARGGSHAFLQLADNGTAQPTRLLAKALDTLPSGQGQGLVLVEASFEADDGSLCRQFRLEQQAGIACREDASWRLVILAETPSPDRFQAAGGGDPIAVASAGLGVTTIFDTAQEAELIETGWTRPRG